MVLLPIPMVHQLSCHRLRSGNRVINEGKRSAIWDTFLLPLSFSFPGMPLQDCMRPPSTRTQSCQLIKWQEFRFSVLVSFSNFSSYVRVMSFQISHLSKKCCNLSVWTPGGGRDFPAIRPFLGSCKKTETDSTVASAIHLSWPSLFSLTLESTFFSRAPEILGRLLLPRLSLCAFDFHYFFL